MKYSVVIPAYNAAKTLAEAIDSVLNQTVPPSQVVVVNDGSLDQTRSIAESFGTTVEVFSQANSGPGSAMSRGMRHCHSPWIASIDADDVWLNCKMERQLQYLADHPTIASVFCRMQLFGDLFVSEATQDGWVRSTMTVKREVFDHVGDLVDPPGMRGEMIDWIVRAREAGWTLVMIPEVMAKRRVHAGSLSHGRDPQKDRGYAHVAMAAIMRRRVKIQNEGRDACAT